MARIRTVKPTIWQDEEFGNASHEARLLFVGLITQADDEGRLHGAPRLLWSQIYPWEDFDPTKLEEWLGELEMAQLIRRYIKGDKVFVALPSWERHQKISHPTPSKLPKAPKLSRRVPEDSGGHSEPNGTDPEGSSLIGKERIGEEGKG